MTSRTLSNEQIEALDFQTDQLYESFRRTVETQSPQDAVWGQELFAAFGKSLSVVTNYSAFMDWSRNTARTPVFDKYLLFYALGSTPSLTLEQQIQARQFGHESEAKKTDVTPEALKQTIDDSNVPYTKIQFRARSLADAHNFTGIVDALEYARERYQRPTK
ncbi:hypothetical protein J4210_00145 [Candidatus Woesearchaeota archaeon]|nr:hypothetical protein [Candidatus Woesearchaeota archaeon]